MKLNKLLITMLCVVLPMSAWAGKSVFINSAIILQQSAPAVAAVKAMQAEFSGRESELRKLSVSVREKESTYAKDQAIMSEAKRKQTEEKIIEMKRKLQFDAQSLKEDVDLRRKQTIGKLRTIISNVIKAYGKKNGYDMIFTEGVAYADESVDITKKILKELESK